MENNDIMIGDVELSSLGLLLREVKITQPEAKRNLVDIPGRDNYLDFTEAFGMVYYYPRENCQVIADYIGDYDEWERVVPELARSIQGKFLRLILGWDQEFYYEGRFHIDPSKKNDVIGEVKITATLNAYKRRCDETSIKVTVDGTREFAINNLFEPVVPKITATGSITLTGNGETIELTPGTTASYQEFILSAGSNVFSASGSGTMIITYREGSL